MNIALLTAAGHGTRMHQDIPKQFIHINNKPIIIYTLEKFEYHPSINSIIVVTLPSWIEVLKAYAKQFNITKISAILNGGETNQDSIQNGLKYIVENYNNEDIVTIHDGNRCAVTHEIISNNLAVCKEKGNAITAIPCTEVVFKKLDINNENVEFLERSQLLRTQTPHSFYVRDLWYSIQEAKKKNIKNSGAICELIYRLNKKIYFSRGSEANIKITTTDDLQIFKALLNTKQDEWIKD